MLIEALCSLSLEEPGHVTAILEVQHRQKVGKFEQVWYISVSTSTDKQKYAASEHTINHIYFGYVQLFRLAHYFSCFFFFVSFCFLVFLRPA